MDESQFKALFIKHSKEINNFLFFLSGDENLSKDLTQDAFLKLWEKRESIKPDSVDKLLYTIARNLHIDHYRRNQVKFKYWRQPHKVSDTQDPSYHMIYEEFQDKVTQAIENLPDPIRTVFLMNRIEKFKYREIAEKLGISIKTVEKRMQRALKEMHQLHKNI